MKVLKYHPSICSPELIYVKLPFLAKIFMCYEAGEEWRQVVKERVTHTQDAVEGVKEVRRAHVRPRRLQERIILHIQALRDTVSLARNVL